MYSPQGATHRIDAIFDSEDKAKNYIKKCAYTYDDNDASPYYIYIWKLNTGIHNV
jgi:hypothetical protein